MSIRTSFNSKITASAHAYFDNVPAKFPDGRPTQVVMMKKCVHLERTISTNKYYFPRLADLTTLYQPCYSGYLLCIAELLKKEKR